MNLPEGGHQKQVMHSLDEQIYVRLYVESIVPKTVTLHQDIDWLNLEKHILLLQCVGLYRSNGKKFCQFIVGDQFILYQKKTLSKHSNYQA